MKRIEIKIVLILIVYEFSAIAAIGSETCQLNRDMENQCRTYSYTVVKPMLDYLRQVEDELQQSKEKDRIISDLRKRLIEQKNNDDLVKELRSQIEFQKIIHTNWKLIENYGKCKDELAEKSIKLVLKEVQVEKLNSTLSEKEQEIADIYIRNKKQSDHQLEGYIKKIIEKDNELKLCQAKEFKSRHSEDCGKCKEEIGICENRVRTEIETRWQQHRTILETQTNLQKKEREHELCQTQLRKFDRILEHPTGCIPLQNFENAGDPQIKVSGVASFNALCDSELAKPGWIVIEQRIGENMINGNVSSYREGFSFVKSNFFLGLEKLYRLTRSQRYELYVHLVLSDDRIEYARYDNFKVDKNKYRNNRYEVTLGYCNGTSDLLDIPIIYYSEQPYKITNIKLIFDHGVGWWSYRTYPRNTNLRVRYQVPTCDPIIKFANMLIRPLS